MENKMYARQAFKCSVCGQEYDNAMNRAHCELNCIRKQEEEAKKAAELKKQEERAASNANVTKLINEAYAALTAHIDLYGEYEHENDDEDDMSNMIKFLHYFMF